MTQAEMFTLAAAMSQAIDHPNCSTTPETRRAWKRSVEMVASAMFPGSQHNDTVHKKRMQFMQATTYHKVKD